MQKIIKYLSITIVVGILLGVFTSFGQTFIPAPFTQLANSYSLWLLFSFVVGVALKTYGFASVAVAGAVVQYLAILFYYVASAIRFDMSFTLESLISLNIVWLVGGTLMGPITGVAGVIAARREKYLTVTVGFMAGLIFSEALYQFLNLGYVAEGIVFSAVGLLFLGLVYLKVRYPIRFTLLWTGLFTGLMYVGIAYVMGSLFD